MERSRLRKTAISAGVFCLLAVASFVLVRCGGSTPMAGMGSANVTISDPPSCTDQFSHVYVTVTGVMAHTSASAPPNAAGWQNLTDQLRNSPVQLDLLNLSGAGPGECLLKQLGSTQALPQGSYQQLRLILADNGSGALNNTSNACPGTGIVNCVEDSSGNFYPLELSSQDITGLKIPPGQIVSGPINVGSGQNVDININFNTCSSLVFDPANNAYRLDPTLTASQVSQNALGITGRVVSANSTTTGVAGATVNMELPGGPMDSANNANTDTVYDTAVTDSNGKFYFCPANTLTGTADIVADAPAPTTGPPGAVAGATIVETVPVGLQGLTVPIVSQTGTSTLPGDVKVDLTANSTTTTGSGTTFPVNIDLFPLQLTASSGGYEFIVPALNNSDSETVEVDCPFSGGTCTLDSNSPSPLTSSHYVPAQAPLVGTYTGGSPPVSWSPYPSATTGVSSGNYAVEADGLVGNNPKYSCTTTFAPSASVSAGGTTTYTVTLSNCGPNPNYIGN